MKLPFKSRVAKLLSFRPKKTAASKQASKNTTSSLLEDPSETCTAAEGSCKFTDIPANSDHTRSSNRELEQKCKEEESSIVLETLLMTTEEIRANMFAVGGVSKTEKGSRNEQQVAAATTVPLHTSMALEGERRISIVKDFFHRINKHEPSSAEELVTDDLQFHFYDLSKTLDCELPWEYWVEEHERINASFPDFRFQYERAVPISVSNDDDDEEEVVVVVLLGFRASGTHTGEPYGLGPCEAIPATGKRVLNDPEEVYCFLRGDKIARIVDYPRGEMTGPPGFYTQIGGFPMM